MVSSTEVRELARRGELDQAAELVPHAVRAHIAEHGLYR